MRERGSWKARNTQIMKKVGVWILNKTKAARCLLESVESHDHPLHISTHGEELIDLLLRRVEGEVAHVERRARSQFLGIFLTGELWK